MFVYFIYYEFIVQLIYVENFSFYDVAFEIFVYFLCLDRNQFELAKDF